jgi:hypothetical protein
MIDRAATERAPVTMHRQSFPATAGSFAVASLRAPCAIRAQALTHRWTDMPMHLSFAPV